MLFSLIFIVFIVIIAVVQIASEFLEDVDGLVGHRLAHGWRVEDLDSHLAGISAPLVEPLDQALAGVCFAVWQASIAEFLLLGPDAVFDELVELRPSQVARINIGEHHS